MYSGATEKVVIALFAVALASLVLGVVLLMHNNRFTGAAFGLTALIAGGVSLWSLLRASKQRSRVTSGLLVTPAAR